jgi:proteasome lid subunit RPN8/RPN11
MSEPSEGQWQALQQLQHIEVVTEGRVRLEDVGASPRGELVVRVSVDCTGAANENALADLHDRESFDLLIPELFPFRKPDVGIPHRRFAGRPNVMWGRALCLYLAANEWHPSQGMHGLIRRLVRWLGALADGSLAGPQVNWHPPLTNKRISPGHLIVRPDLPDDGADQWAAVEAVGGNRYEVRRWFPELPARPPQDLPAGRCFLAPMLVLPRPVGFDYPTELGELVSLLREQGVSGDRFRKAWVENDRSWWIGPPPGTDARPLNLIILGSPAPHRSASRAAVAHLAVWEVQSGKELAWMEVFDQRPRIATRRDTERPVAWLRGKRVLLLGCGGLGAPVAEFCARAGATTVRLVDTGGVTPGILVRQPYSYAEIGWPKVVALGERLRTIAPGMTVEAAVTDAVTLAAADLTDADLIIDATASPSVAASLEHTWSMAGEGLPPLLSMGVGHRCDSGFVTLARPGASGAGADLLRRLGLAAAADDDLADVLDDFFPDPPRADVFQPEPGCSDPTYVGSATDLAVFAGGLLNEGLAALGAAERDDDPQTVTPRRFASVMRLPGEFETVLGRRRFLWLDDLVQHENGHGYQVRFTPESLAAMRIETLRMADERGPLCETGGVLLGQIDHGARVVWVTEADSLPPDSRAEAHQLTMNPRSVDGYVQARRRRTHGLVGYVGAWHTHPMEAAGPSKADGKAAELLVSTGAPSLMVIAGGTLEVWRQWLRGRGRPDIFTELTLP